MITGSENLLEVAEKNSTLLTVFEKHGLGSYFKPENLEKIGRFTRLSTLLKSNNINLKSFIAVLNEMLEEKENAAAPNMQKQEDLHFAAMLPCGLRNPFKEFSEAFLNNNSAQFAGLNYLIEGNVNHELSYYPLLDSIYDENELPDIIMASDVNNFFHRPFIDRFIKKGVFESYSPYKPNMYLEKSGFADPDKNFTMYTANMLVMVVDKSKLGSRKMPEKWNDLLSSEFENDIIMRGEDDFFCNAVMLPFYKDNGMDAIRILAKNIKKGLHPAEMVKLAGKNKEEGAAVYIMPYFFYKRITNLSNIEMIWPADGAIASPVFLLAKKNKIETHKPLLEFLMSEETAQLLLGRYFPSVHPGVEIKNLPEAVKWLGWDFLNQNDIGLLKNQIRDEFMKVWRFKTMRL